MSKAEVETAPKAIPRAWPLFLAGAFLVVVGPFLYFAQLALRQVWMPWYLPVLATVGVLLMIVSVRRRPGIVRGVGLALFALLCVLEWHFFVEGSKNPPYTGPATPGRRIPEFAASLADGSAWTHENLSAGTPSVLVFFRGRW